MKHVILLAVMAVSTLGFAQKNKVELPEMPMDTETGLVTYSGKHKVDGAVATDLYDRAFTWASGYYKNVAEKLRVQDKENGRMEILGRFTIFAHDKKGVLTTSKIALVQYKMNIDFKDGRYRYTVTKFNKKAKSYQAIEQWLAKGDDNMANNAYKLMDIDAHIVKMLEGFNKALQTAPNTDDDDW